jgi:hypothetical protein
VGGAVGRVGRGGEKGAGVGVSAFGQDLRRRPGLHDLAPVHHRDAVGHAGDHGEVVGDEEQRHVLLRHEVLQEIEDLRLRGDVEGGRGLVRDQEARVQRDGGGDADALTLAAGELVRVGVEADMFEAHPVEAVAGDGEGSAAVSLPVDRKRLCHLVPDGLDGVQGRHRLLKDHRDVVAAERAEGGFRQVEEVPAVDADGAIARRRRRAGGP